MRYFGGKARIAKDLSKFINENYLKGNTKPFVDLFCGSCNITTKIDKDRLIIANDKHKYLMEMWKALQKGWIPPKDCTEEQYKIVLKNLDIKPYVSGFIGFGCSYSGKWLGGYCRDNIGRNYCLNAHNSVLKKINEMKDVIFTSTNYNEVDIPLDSIVYCDIPYKNTTQYSNKEVGKFGHNEFYDWVRKNHSKYTILISEYECNVPDDFEVIWKKESKQDIRSNNGKMKTVEILMVYKGGNK